MPRPDFPWLQMLLLVASYAALNMGTLLVWRSQWNIFGYGSLGFFVVTYLVPLMFTDQLRTWPPGILNLYTGIMLAGSVFYLLGLWFGFRLPRGRVLQLFRAGENSGPLIRRRTLQIVTLSVVGLYVSFAIMGYIPLFADDPLMAKYARGDYRAGYFRAIWLYLPCLQAFVGYLPLFMFIMWRSRRIQYLLVLLAGLLSMALTLQRGELGGPVLFGLVIITAASRRKSLLCAFVIFSTALYFIGALGNYFVFRVMGLPTLQVPIAEIVAAGSADVQESIVFLEEFESHGQYSLGRTIVGGLIPFRYKWSPGIWTVEIEHEMTEEEAGDYPSRGIHIAFPIMEYAAFDWPGVMVLSLLTGLLTGYIVGFAERRVPRSPPEVAAVVFVVCSALLGIVNTNALEWHTLILVLMLVPVFHPVNIILRRRPERVSDSVLVAG